MPMDVTLPNGTVIRNVPDGTGKEEIKQKAIAGGYATLADFGEEIGTLEYAARMPLEVTKGVTRGFTKGLLSSASGLAEIADAATDYIGAEDLIDSGNENWLINLANQGKQAIDENLGIDEQYKDSYLVKLGEGLGSIGSIFVPGGAAGLLGKAAAGAKAAKYSGLIGSGSAGVGLGGQEQADRIQAARARGIEISDDDADLSVLAGGLVGASEAWSPLRVLKKIRGIKEPEEKLKGLKKDYDNAVKEGRELDAARIRNDMYRQSREINKIKDGYQRLSSAVREGSVEAFQEAGAGLAQDAIQFGMYDEDVSFGDSLWDDVTVGGGAGALLDLIATGSANRRSRITREVEEEKEKQLRKQEDIQVEEYYDRADKAKLAFEDKRAKEERQKKVMLGMVGSPEKLPVSINPYEGIEATKVGDQIIVFDADGNARATDVIDVEQDGGLVVKGLDGQRQIVGFDTPLENASNPDFVMLSNFGVKDVANKKVSELSDEELNKLESNISRISKEDKDSGQEVDQVRSNALATNLSAVKNEKRRRLYDSFDPAAEYKGDKTEDSEKAADYASQLARDAIRKTDTFPEVGSFVVVEEKRGAEGSVFKVVHTVSGQQYGTDSRTNEFAIHLASNLNNELINRKINSAVLDAMDISPESYTEEQGESIYRIGQILNRPKRYTVTSAALNEAAGTTTSPKSKYMEDMSLDNLHIQTYGVGPLRDRGEKIYKDIPNLTASQELNLKRVRQGLREVDEFTLDEAKEILGDKYSNLFDVLMDAKYPDMKDVREAFGTVGVDVARSREQYQDEKRTREDLKKALVDKNILSDIDSPEIKYIFKRIVNEPDINKMSPSQRQYLINEIQRTFPKVAEPVSLPNFTPKPYTAKQYDLILRDVIATGDGSRANIETIISELFLDEFVGYKTSTIAKSIYDDLKKSGLIDDSDLATVKPIGLPKPDDDELTIRPYDEGVSEEAKQFEEQLKQTMKGFGLEDIGLRVMDLLKIGPTTREGEVILTGDPRETSKVAGAEGYYQPKIRSIFLGLDRAINDIKANSRDDTPEARRSALADTLDHEILHAMRDLDLWTEQEWSLLENLVRKKTHQGTNETFLDKAQRLYDDKSAVIQMEEAVAELIRTARKDRSFVTGKPRSLIEKMYEFIEKLNNALRGSGFQSFNDIMDRLESGDIGARKRGEIRTLKSLEKKIGALPERDIGKEMDVADVLEIEEKERIRREEEGLPIDLWESDEESQILASRIEDSPPNIIFEVAPDPDNVKLTSEWNELEPSAKEEISNIVSEEVVGDFLSSINVPSLFSIQVGSYLEDTNPSFAVSVDTNDPLGITKQIGFMLNQQSMITVASNPFPGLDKTESVIVSVNTNSPLEIQKIYQELRGITVEGDQPIGGQSTINGQMVIFNYSGLPNNQLADLVDKKLNGVYEVAEGDAYTAFPEKEDYDYANPQEDPSGNEGYIRRQSRYYRTKAQELLQPSKYQAVFGLGKKYRPEDLTSDTDDVLFSRRKSSTPIESAVDLANKKYSDYNTRIEEEFFKRFWPKLLSEVKGTVSTDKVRTAAKRANKDIKKFVHDNPRYRDYYNQDMAAVRKLLGDHLRSKYGKNITDEDLRLYQLFNGLNSANTKLSSNVGDAINVFNLFQEKGNLDDIVLGLSKKGNVVIIDSPFQISGTSSPIKGRSLKAVDRLIKLNSNRKNPVQATVDFLHEGVPLKELQQFNRQMGYKSNVTDIKEIKSLVMDATGQDELIPRMFIFGKKVGAYTLNLTGDHRYTTIDIWESRFIRTYFDDLFKERTGLPEVVDEGLLFQDFSKKFGEEYERLNGIKLAPSALQAMRWFYIIDASRRAGYSGASTNETISEITDRYLNRPRGERKESRRRSDGEVAGQVQTEAEKASKQKIDYDILESRIDDSERAVNDLSNRSPDSPLLSIANQNPEIQKSVSDQTLLDEEPFSWQSMSHGLKGYGAFDRFVYQIQDKFVGLKNVRDQINQYRKRSGLPPIHIKDDPYIGEESIPGKIGFKTRKFEEERKKPLAKKLADLGLTLDEVDEFLILRHAIERNNLIEKRDSERGVESNPGSGQLKTGESLTNSFVKRKMSQRYDMQWNDATGEWSGGNARARKLLDVAKDADQIVQETMRTTVEGGLIDQDSADAIMNTYKYYSPLRGKDIEDDYAENVITGASLSTKGRDVLRAMGRTSAAQSPLGHILLNAERSIARAEKNKNFGQKLVNLVKNNPNPDYWRIISPDDPNYIRAFEKKYTYIGSDPDFQGQKFNEIPEGMSKKDFIQQIKLVPDNLTPAFDKDLIGVKIDGKQVYVELQDARLKDAIVSMDIGTVDNWIQKFGMINRFLSMVNTSLNPEFVVGNFSRDLQTAIFNILGEQNMSQGKAKDQQLITRVLKDVIPSMGTFYKGLRRYDLKDGTLRGNLSGISSQDQKDFEEYLASGAKADWFHSRDPEQQVKTINALIDMSRGTFTGDFRKRYTQIMDFVEDSNSAVENAVRFATFKASRDELLKAGASREDAVARAASLAKNLTINFNRKGMAGDLANSFYLFFNASVQGTANFARGLFGPKGNPFSKEASRAKQGAVAGLIGFGALSAMRAEEESEENPETGRSYYSEIPDYIKERNIVVMADNGREYYTIPLPYGYNVFHVLGQSTYEMMQENISRETATANILSAFFGSFSPIGVSALSPIPTIGQPTAEILRNENFFGSPIKRENFPTGTPYPESSLARSTTRTAFKATAKYLNELSFPGYEGGNVNEPGLIDISPDTLEHYFEFILGGAGTFGMRSLNLVEKAAKKEDIELNEIPFYRRIKGEPDDRESMSDFFERKDKIRQKIRQRDSLYGDEHIRYLEKNEPYFDMLRDLEDAESELRDLREERNSYKEDAAMSPKMANEYAKMEEAVYDQMNSVYNRFNKEYDKVVGRTK
tara:strand:- start:25 stop:8766 length:8742 start_codon:yes stop_codon:yes gene_type:complete